MGKKTKSKPQKKLPTTSTILRIANSLTTLKNLHIAPDHFHAPPHVIRFYDSPHASSATFLPAALALFEENMEALYETSSFGYDRQEKLEELGDQKHARFIVVEQEQEEQTEQTEQEKEKEQNRQDQTDLIAFSHFRFCPDDDDKPTNKQQPVVYCYELQVGSKHQGKKLGKMLMHMLEEIAKGAGCGKVMLTVFKSNVNALGFYRRLGYKEDESDPSNFGEESDYFILSLVV